LRAPFAPVHGVTHDEIDWVLRRVGVDDPTHRIAF
jgi:hypothetical protein